MSRSCPSCSARKMPDPLWYGLMFGGMYCFSRYFLGLAWTYALPIAVAGVLWFGLITFVVSLHSSNCDQDR